MALAETCGFGRPALAALWEQVTAQPNIREFSWRNYIASNEPDRAASAGSGDG